MTLRARDLMKPDPITIRPDAPFLEVQHLFVAAHIGGAPVVDERGNVRGILSRADLLGAIDQACDEDLDPGEDAEHLVAHLETMTAGDIATPEPVWVAPDEPISEVAQRMRDAGVHRVLVGTGGSVVGILTSFDLLQAVRS